ncbi:MAG: AAA family ATPase [Pseudomonadota bacterium]
MIEIPGYVTLAGIYDGRFSMVFRAVRGGDGLPVVLKMLKGTYPTSQAIERYRHEYEITRSLGSLSGVIRAYGLEKYENTLVMSLEDFGARSLDILPETQTATIGAFLRIAIRVVEIIGEIHGLNVVHKDINPSNIVMNPKTGEIKIIDFGISTHADRVSNVVPSLPEGLEGTLPYMSPEQTGRMNRTLDHRTDYYSLGATFYRLLTGRHLFDTMDSLEIVHGHLAKMPRPPHEIDPGIPRAVSDITMRLLAKNPDDRYQSASGIKADLTECFERLPGSGPIDSFSLGARDVPERFRIPGKLYGRRRELDYLDDLLGKVGPGSKELVLISGEAGIGKTSLVREIYKPGTSNTGYFAAGKFEQHAANVPYSAVMAAFRDLVLQILSESSARLETWRANLVDALGAGVQVITDVIPEMKLIVGPQPPVPKLGPIESRNRFNHLVRRFVRLFCRPGHPLVLFLDDLQWADSASLNLLKLIMADEETQSFLLIGAYREEETDVVQPLMRIVDELRQDNVLAHHLSLEGLGIEELTELAADTVHQEASSAAPLAHLLHRKAAGNPFFTTEFLKSLVNARLLYFDAASGTWKWDIDKIEAQSIADNVVELVSGNIMKLTHETRHVLKMAACVGNPFDLDTLAIVCEQPASKILDCVNAAVAEGLVLPLENRRKPIAPGLSVTDPQPAPKFKFAHDRIRQAAYRLIPDPEKPAFHYRVGRLLLDAAPPPEFEARVFAVANHFNAGAEHARSASQRVELARLNLAAGKKAKKSAAFELAYGYFKAGLRALETDSWATRYNLALELHVEGAEAAYLCTAFDEMERLCHTVLRNAGSLLDKVKAHEVMIQASIAQSNMLEALERALEVLALLGVHIPGKPSTVSIVLEMIRTKRLLYGKRIETLANLPEMTDPVYLAAIRIITGVAKAAYVARPELAPMLVFRGIALTLKYGGSPESAFFYATYGVFLCSIFGDIDAGCQFGDLALGISERLDSGRLKTRTLMAVNFFIRPWKEHYLKVLDRFERVYEVGLETGNFEDAALIAYIRCSCAFRTGMDLAAVDNMMTLYGEVIRKLKQESALQLLAVFHQTVLNLLGRASDPCKLIGDVYDEEKMLPIHRQANDRSAVCVAHLNKLVLSCLFKEYEQALADAEITESHLAGIRGTPGVPVFHFYDSLVRLALFDSSPVLQRTKFLLKVTRNQRKMRKWAHHGPMNCLHKYQLVEAERMRVLGRHALAEQLYDRAIKLAKENQYINEEALACELAGNHYLAQGRTGVARAYFSDACYCYGRWGAKTKVERINAEHGLLDADHSGTGTAMRDGRITMTGVTTEGKENMDLAWVLRASQALSGEILQEKLLGKIMTTVIESAGAQKGLLIQEIGGKLLVTAEARADQDESSMPGALPMEDCPGLSQAIVRYTARTKENVVLNNACEEGQFANDPYVRTKRPKSILCTPLIHQGKLTAILYLENNLAAGAFTPNRIEVLQVLCSQAAISLENAQLYERMEQLVAERTADLLKSNAELNKQISETAQAQQAFLKAKLSAEAANRAKSDFLANMSHELRTPLNAIIGFAEMLEDQVFGKLSEKQLTHAGHIVKSGRHLLDLINDVLDLAKVESGKIKLKTSMVGIHDLLLSCTGMIKEESLKHDITLDVHVAGDLHEAKVSADETKLKQIVFNLLSNAAKFTPDGGRIELLAERQGNDVVISVVDSGIGLKQEDSERIFFTFEQAHSSKQVREKGTGLGLTLSRRLVELHGGRIWVESEGLGKGCTFRFSIPFRTD